MLIHPSVHPYVRTSVRPSTNSVIFAYKKRIFGLLLTFIGLFRGFLAWIWAYFWDLGLDLDPCEGYWPGFGSFWVNFGGSEPVSEPIFWVLGLDFDLLLGSGPGFGSFWANFGGYGPGFGSDLGLFWVLGLDLVHFGSI